MSTKELNELEEKKEDYDTDLVEIDEKGNITKPHKKRTTILRDPQGEYS